MNRSISAKMRNFPGLKLWWPLPLLGFLFWFGGKTITFYALKCDRESNFMLHIEPETHQKATTPEKEDKL